MGVGVAKGENRIVDAVRFAVNSPLLDTTIEGAKGVILNILGGNDLTMDEVQMAATLVQSVVDYSANIIFGAGIDPNINDEVEVTVIATGFPAVDPASSSKDTNAKAGSNKALDNARNNFTRTPQALQINIPQTSSNLSALNNNTIGQPQHNSLQSQRNIFPYQTITQQQTQQPLNNQNLLNRTMMQPATRQSIQQPLQQQNTTYLNTGIQQPQMQNMQGHQQTQPVQSQQNSTQDDNENLPAFVRRILRK